MHFHRLFNIIRRLLGRERALARCPVASRRRLQVVLFLFALTASHSASASVLVTGDVTPADNPFTTGVNEGLPTDGNFINPFEAVDRQTYFEGRHLDNNVADLLDDTNVNIAEIIVGKSASGTLLISGESALRDQDLIIGDQGMRGGIMRVGTGVVRITGFGSLYNNDPNIIPPGLPGNFASQTPRPLDVGFDLYVGRAGTGTLEISAGARAEIQDAVVVGSDPSSSGNIIVDGFDSFLGSGGFSDSGSSTTATVHQMIIGQQGIGYMTITNGGTVRADSTPTGAGTGNIGPIGAVIGSDPFSFTEGEQPDPGGFGTVTVNGTASKWIVGGSLQIGGFDIGAVGVLLGDPEGDNTKYNSEAGRGILNVQAGGLVNVVNSIGADPTEPDLLLAVGRFGRIQLDGGLINVGGVTGEDNEARSSTVQLINDGVITGSGRIETGVFNNRYFGEVRVDAGQKLVIDSSSDFDGITSALPLTNYGVMQVFGTVDAKAELEFDRAPSTLLDVVQPFQNLRVERPTGAPIADFYGGLISAQHSILRFRSGLLNSGMMAFTAGNNYVTGNVVNMPGPIISPADTGIIIVSGPGTKVTFENDLINAGVINISGGASIEILARHSFVTAGDLKLTLTPNNANQIFSAGDAGIDGKLSISLSGFAPGSLQVGDSFQIISVTGQMGGVDMTDPTFPKVDLNTAPLFDLVSFPNLASLGLPATTALVPIYTSNSVLVSVVSLAAAVGPDFNGDGVVNGLDLNVWLANVGITSGASVVQGDADGDGDVDGDDFLFWQRNVGQPMPWTGSGSGSGSSLSAAVPEPTSLVLFLMGAAYSLAFRPRRRAR
jgi:T5SS/PEP-CTERM-associated repeat protein